MNGLIVVILCIAVIGVVELFLLFRVYRGIARELDIFAGRMSSCWEQSLSKLDRLTDLAAARAIGDALKKREPPGAGRDATPKTNAGDCGADRPAPYGTVAGGALPPAPAGVLAQPVPLFQQHSCVDLVRLRSEAGRDESRKVGTMEGYWDRNLFYAKRIDIKGELSRALVFEIADRRRLGPQVRDALARKRTDDPLLVELGCTSSDQTVLEVPARAADGKSQELTAELMPEIERFADVDVCADDGATPIRLTIRCVWRGARR